MSKLVPYIQGSLDDLCGLYALINASRLVDSSIKEQDCKKVFHDSIRLLSKEYKDLPSLGGLEIDHLIKLQKDILKKKWPEIQFDPIDRQFLRRMPPKSDIKANKDFWSRMLKWMKQEAAKPNQGLFIGIDQRIAHWSVVSEIDNTKIHLFDSGDYSELLIKKCGPRAGNGIDYVISPKYVYLFSKKI